MTSPTLVRDTVILIPGKDRSQSSVVHHFDINIFLNVWSIQYMLEPFSGVLMNLILLSTNVLKIEGETAWSYMRGLEKMIKLMGTGVSH